DDREDRSRDGPVRRRSVAELALAVAPPAPHRAVPAARAHRRVADGGLAEWQARHAGARAAVLARLADGAARAAAPGVVLEGRARVAAARLAGGARADARHAGLPARTRV